MSYFNKKNKMNMNKKEDGRKNNGGKRAGSGRPKGELKVKVQIYLTEDARNKFKQNKISLSKLNQDFAQTLK